MAQDAKNQTEDAIQKEKEDFEKYNEIFDQYVDGKKTQVGPDKKGEILTANKSDYTDDTGTAVIPGGFCVVKDSEEDKTDKNTVRDGLVISDVAGDDLDNSKHGNQFVWIPVTDYSKFHLIEGYQNGNLQTRLSEASNPSREAGDTATAGSPGKPNAANSTAGSTESTEMYKSVKDNGGFYIARFEAGISGTAANSTLSIKTVTDGTVKPLSQKGVGVWDIISWGGTTAVEASDGLTGNDNANGAVKVARNMYGASDTTHKVTSTLCYGVQWDAALNFIDSNYESGASTGYVKNSTNMGNYSGSLATTGSNTAYQQKHIYDMAGNAYELTMEAYSTGRRVIRGGYSYTDGGRLCPASVRSYTFPDDSGDSTGFRPALYL